MNERLLQYIWQFRHTSQTLVTVAGEPIQVVYPGIYNTNQGPDFLDAKIRIGRTLWAGNIEIHVRSSDWRQHRHTGDRNYKNIILHVVWQHDEALALPFPTLVLNDKVPKLLMHKYRELMRETSDIPCIGMISQVNSLVWISWKERLIAERLEQRSALIATCLKENNHHWEETFWWLLARGFGVKVNSDAFEQIARSLPAIWLAKHKQQIHQVEALLLGQAGLLEKDFSEAYPQLLQKEYRFLAAKYQLKPIKVPVHFLRMRPSHFPTVRLAQLAMLICNSVHLFSKISEAETLKEIREMLNVTANDYWHYHYTFDEIAAFKKKNTGQQMIDTILINTIVPVMFAYGHFNKQERYKAKALNWLEQIKAERNTIIDDYAAAGIKVKTSFDSQALIQLKKYYCLQKRCLECAVGNHIIRNK